MWRLITDNHFDPLYINARENQRSNHERENQRHMQLWAHDTERRQTKQKHEKTKKDQQHEHVQREITQIHQINNLPKCVYYNNK